MSDVAILAEGLGKKYRLGRQQERYSTIRDQIGKWISARTSMSRAVRRAKEPDFWALRDVSFEVKCGEVVGIIGRNGAGKSTLLKILSRITEPTEGGADVFGRVGSLLEVGTGFHPELTGRENIFLNGAILGMRRAETARKFDDIVAFAEVEKFVDTQVKHYSSGMYTRLAFAVAAHLDPEILIVDEVLSVGDAEFQKKCLGKMGEVARGGRTVLFVSHNMHAVNSLCSRSLVLQRGSIVFDGEAAAGVARYLDQSRLATVPDIPPEARPGSGEWRFMQAAPTKYTFDPDEPKEFTFQIAPTHDGAGAAYLSGLLLNDVGTVLAQFDSRLLGLWLTGSAAVSGRLRVAGVWLKPGEYSLDLYLCSPGGIIDCFERCAEFEVSPILPYAQSVPSDATASGLVLADFSWRLDL